MSTIIGMYGPPQNCKRKIEITVWSGPMYSAFGGVQDSWPGWIPPALFFISVAALKASTDIRLRKRRFDRCAISVIRQQTWQGTLHWVLTQGAVANAGIRYVSFLHNTAQAIPSSLFASAAQEPACCDTASQLALLARTVFADRSFPVC